LEFFTRFLLKNDGFLRRFKNKKNPICKPLSQGNAPYNRAFLKIFLNTKKSLSIKELLIFWLRFF